MIEILKDAMNVKKQVNEIRQMQLELQSDEMKQSHVFFQNILAKRQQQQERNQGFFQCTCKPFEQNSTISCAMRQCRSAMENLKIRLPLIFMSLWSYL